MKLFTAVTALTYTAIINLHIITGNTIGWSAETVGYLWLTTLITAGIAWYLLVIDTLNQQRSPENNPETTDQRYED